jgi:pimeloyl-ACP methyl ester carboxylesterase
MIDIHESKRRALAIPQAAHFTGPRTHRQVPDAGHNLPREAPQAFAQAVLDLANPDRKR